MRDIKAYYLSTVYEDVMRCAAEIKELTPDRERQATEIKTIKNEITSIRTKISSTHKACEQINIDLHAFLGHQECRLKPDESNSSKEGAPVGYRMRGDQPAAYLTPCTHKYLALLHLLARFFFVYSHRAEREWEGHIVAQLLILALIAPLVAAFTTVQRIPLDFSPSTMNLPSIIIGSSSSFLLFEAGCYFMPVATFPLLGFGFALGLPITAALLMWRTAPGDGNSPADYHVLIAIAFAYSCGLIYFLNGVLTPTPATRLISTVVSKRSGVGGFPNHYLHLSSTDPRVGDGEWRVSKESFRASRVGAHACVDLYRGKFGATWYRAGPCPVTSDEKIPWVGFNAPGWLKVEF